jgi:hypothetical protein
VFIVFIVSVLGEIGRHWPQFCYAITGTVVSLFFRDHRVLRPVPDWLHWTDLPWPWSQLAFELSRPALLALAALSVLAAGLVIERSFHWVSLLRTFVLSLALIAFAHYSTDLFPWLLRPVPGDQNHGRYLIIPGIVQLVLFFSTFLIAAWLGCVSPRHADELGRDGSRLHSSLREM